jgi:Zn-dependent peptidase ImmA (M78 family)
VTDTFRAVGIKKAREKAVEILDQHNVIKAPVPVERLAKKLGASVRFSPFDDSLSGMITIKDGAIIIGINALHHPNRQRFSIAHELGHLVLHRDFITNRVHVDKSFALHRDEVSASGEDRLEIDANAFASELLIPREWLRREISADVDLEDDRALASLAKQFRVSKVALQNRLLNALRD